MKFNLTEKEGDETIEVLALFIYLGRPMYQSDDDWTAVRRNIGMVRQVWVRLGIILMQEGVDHLTFVTFHRVVVQEVILFGAETWVISMTTEEQLSGVHMGFL